MKKNEKGAIVVEATISLTTFIFTILTILSIVDICYIQARIGTALNSSAKEVSQYLYLYYEMGLNGLDKDLSEGTSDSKELAESTIDNVSDFMGAVGDIKDIDLENTKGFDEIESEVEKIKGNVNTIKDSVGKIVNDYKDALSSPKEFIIGMARLAGSELKEEGKALIGQVMARVFMEKNLKSYDEGNPDDFLKIYDVVDGMDGLNFQYTTLMAYGTSNEIQLVCTYEVQVIKLLNIDFKFKFRQVAKALAWGEGISVEENKDSADPGEPSENFWDMENDKNKGRPRGQQIILKEKENWEYTYNGGFHIYDNSEGKNQFIKITTTNTHDKSYQTTSGIKNKMNKVYEGLKEQVSKLGNEIKVKDKHGNDVTLQSDTNTRSYKIIFVVPEDSDMEKVNEAKRQFESEHPGVVIEINTNYGSPTKDK